MNKEFMIQQGGVSKATKTVNLSEERRKNNSGAQRVGCVFVRVYGVLLGFEVWMGCLFGRRRVSVCVF